MHIQFRLLMLLLFCLVGGWLISPTAHSDPSASNHAKSDGAVVETGSFPILGGEGQVTLHYHNFHPESDEAKRGLAYLYKSNLLGIKGGFSLRALQNVSKIPILKNYGNVSQYGDAAYQWRQYGYLPSPASRTMGKIPEQLHFPIQVNLFPLGDNGYVPKEDREILTLGCLTCHTGVMAGQVIAGMGNNYVDFRPYLADNKGLRAMQRAIKLNPLWKSSSIARFGMTLWEVSFLDLEIHYFQNVLTPMLEAQVTRGAMTGSASTLTYLTRLSTNTKAESLVDSLRQDTIETIREDLKQSPYPTPPADPNPWWNIKYKTRLYLYPEYKGESFDRMTENFMHRHIGVSDQIAPLHLQKVRDVMSFVVQTKAPAYPWPLDAERVERGRQAFHEKPVASRSDETCATCHGRYQIENGKLVVEYQDYYDDVSTDPAVFEVGKYMMETTLKRVDPAELPNYKPYEQDRGYPAPPLVGVWASAPYLHNGSIPTLYGVIKMRSRPDVWARPFDPRVYDQKKGGIQIIDPAEAHDPSFVYDTSRTGYLNKGHVYGHDWDDETVYDVIEFLKSLSE